MKKFILSFFVLSSYLAGAQTLVSDFNSGTTDGFNEWNYKGAYINDDIIFPIVSATVGEELAILKNGQISIVKDINPSGDSEPTEFTNFNGRVYFSAFDGTKSALWESDGTTAGTKLSFDPQASNGGIIKGLTLAKSGLLYFTCENKLYSSNGTTTTKIFDGVDFTMNGSTLEKNYCTYNNEIAFIVKVNSEAFLYTIVNNQATLLASTSGLKSFTECAGLCQVTEGLIYSQSNSFYDDQVATFIYRTSTNSISKLSISAANPNYERLVNYTPQKAFAWVRGTGFCTLNGVDNGEALISAEGKPSYQGQPIYNAVFNNKILFCAIGSNFWDKSYAVYTDGTTANTTQLFETSSYPSDILAYKNYSFLVSGVSNGFDSKFYSINMQTGAFEHFLTLSKSSNVFLLGVQDGKLYFISDVETTAGLELYWVDLNVVPTSMDTPIIQNNGVDVTVSSTGFIINSDESVFTQLRVVDLQGRVVKEQTCNSKVAYDLSDLKGIYILQFKSLKGESAYKYFGKTGN